MNIDGEFLKKLADSLSRPDKNKEEVYVFQEKTDEYLWSLVPKMKELVTHPKSKDKVVNEKYSDQEIATTIFDTAYSKINAQPMIHANNSPNATYA